MEQPEFNFDATTFDAALSAEAKADGIAAATSHRKQLLAKVQAALVQIALSRESRTATADDGQAWLIEQGYLPKRSRQCSGEHVCAQ